MSAPAPGVLRPSTPLKPRLGGADATPMRRCLTRVHAEDGLTLIELMVAALVLIVGVLATVGTMTTGMAKTGLNAQRVAATNLVRELTEAARIAPYPALTPTGLTAAVQDASSTLGSGTPWQVVRRNTTYTIDGTACAYDDPSDKLAATQPDDRCPLPAGTDTATGDQNGDDFRRVTFTVTWMAEGRSQRFTQSALVVNPSGGLGPRILPPLPTVAPITSASQTSVTFPVYTSSASALHWTADDGGSEGTGSGGRTTWSVTWPIGTPGAAGAVPDGTYTVGLQAFDARSIPGDSRAVAVPLNRSVPVAPTGFKGGHNTRSTGWLDFEWSLNPERDILGYQVFDAGADRTVGGGDDTRVCPPLGAPSAWLENASTSCQDTAAASTDATYYLQALDRDPSGQARAGAATRLTVAAPGDPPAAPEAVTLTTVAPPTLSWSAPASGGVAFYRVYRDGTAPDDRVGRLVGTSYVDHGGNDGKPHDYWVSAVSADFNESALVGPLSWSG